MFRYDTSHSELRSSPPEPAAMATLAQESNHAVHLRRSLRMRQFKGILCVVATLATLPARAEGTPPRIRIVSPAPASAAEYYTSEPGAGVVVRINIWGEVARPGVHFVALGSSIMDSVSGAGGPMATASTPEVRLFRHQKASDVDLFSPAGALPVQEGDTIFIDRSVQSELPLIFAAISTVLSLGAFYLVLNERKN